MKETLSPFVATLDSHARPSATRLCRLSLALMLSAVFCLPVLAQNGKDAPQQPRTHKAIAEGVSIELKIEPLGTAALAEDRDAVVSYKITYAETGVPLTGLRPAAWIGRREADAAAAAPPSCRRIVQSYLQANFSTRAEIDLNSYFLLTLNNEPNISVIDPISGFGTSKLFTLVELSSPGEDWVLSRDQKRLYVSLPLGKRVAVIDTASWKVVAEVDVKARPARLALQGDGRYLWVGDDDGGAGDKTATAAVGASGVSVIDLKTLKVAARVETGGGTHEIAFSDDERHALVAGKRGGTLSVIDARSLAKLKELKVGSRPSALAYSPLGKVFYVADESDGTISVLDGQRFELITRLKAKPGLRFLRVSPDGRYLFAVNHAANSILIIDVATNRLLQTVPVEASPDQITFTKDFAYVRSLGSHFVTMIRLGGIGKDEAGTSIARFPGGQLTPGSSPHKSPADAIVNAPESGSVIVANPADKMLYYYTEGMAAPMGSFQNYRRTPRAVLVKDNSLRETAPGLYSATVRFNSFGRFDVALLIDSPRVTQCFDIAVAESPEKRVRREVAVKIEPLAAESVIPVGQSYKLRFKVVGNSDGRPKVDLKDVGILTFLAPGVWQERTWSRSVGGGVYEANFTPPHAGIYYIYFHCPSLNLDFNQSPYLILRAEKKGDASAQQ